MADSLCRDLAAPPWDWDTSPVTAEWARNAFAGQLWQYLEVRCDTVTSLFAAVQDVVNRHHGAFMPFGVRQDRDVLGGLDYSVFYRQLKRASLGCRGKTVDERRTAAKALVAEVPPWAAPEVMHNQRIFRSREELCAEVALWREAGVRHHSFHYYDMTPRVQLDWIGHARQAWR